MTDYDDMLRRLDDVALPWARDAAALIRELTIGAADAATSDGADGGLMQDSHLRPPEPVTSAAADQLPDRFSALAEQIAKDICQRAIAG